MTVCNHFTLTLGSALLRRMSNGGQMACHCSQLYFSIPSTPTCNSTIPSFSYTRSPPIDLYLLCLSVRIHPPPSIHSCLPSSTLSHPSRTHHGHILSPGLHTARPLVPGVYKLSSPHLLDFRWSELLLPLLMAYSLFSHLLFGAFPLACTLVCLTCWPAALLRALTLHPLQRWMSRQVPCVACSHKGYGFLCVETIALAITLTTK